MAVDIEWLKKGRYGYRRLFYFTPPEFALKNIENGHVKISEFDKCNDIFELGPFDLKEKGLRQKHREWVAKANSKIGLICFSGKWDSPLMWGHYADGGRGLCLVFDVEEQNLREIMYEDERLTAQRGYQFPDVSLNDNFIRDCSHKHNMWNYEDEIRLFVDYSDSQVRKDSSRKFLKLGKQLKLTGIVNGPKPKLSMKKIQSAAKCKTIPFFQCRAAFGKFEATLQKNKKLWKLDE